MAEQITSARTPYCQWIRVIIFTALTVLLIAGVREPIGFVDSLYFSLITVSTVGYGDIPSASDAVRAVTAVEVMIGILLFLFGFYGIMRYLRRSNGSDGE
jgi:voltage-gated potassium channel Kch